MESITLEAEKVFKAIKAGTNTNIKLSSKFNINGEAASSRVRRLRNKKLVIAKLSKKTIKGQKYFLYFIVEGVEYTIKEKSTQTSKPKEAPVTYPDYLGAFLYPNVIAS